MLRQMKESSALRNQHEAFRYMTRELSETRQEHVDKRVQRVYTFSYHFLITSFGRVREFNLLALGQMRPRLTA